jgi:hypothetical protein
MHIKDNLNSDTRGKIWTSLHAQISRPNA